MWLYISPKLLQRTQKRSNRKGEFVQQTAHLSKKELEE